MKKLSALLIITSAIVFFVVASNKTNAAAIEIYGSVAPHNTSPSYSSYRTNGLNGVLDGGISVGDPLTDPEAFEVVNELYAYNLVATSENSWKGDFSPSGTFSDEHGQRGGFWHLVQKTSESFVDLQNFVVDVESDDNLLNFTANYSSLSFNGTTRWGVDYGLDDMLGGGDDTILTSGNQADAFVTFVSNTYITDQANYSATLDYILGNTLYMRSTATYDGALQKVETLNVIPEPKSLILFLFGISTLFWLRKKFNLQSHFP